MKLQRTTEERVPMNECYSTGAPSSRQLYTKDSMNDMRILEVRYYYEPVALNFESFSDHCFNVIYVKACSELGSILRSTPPKAINMSTGSGVAPAVRPTKIDRATLVIANSSCVVWC